MIAAPAPATETVPAKLPEQPKLHIEKITKLEDIAGVIAKLNAQKPAGMQVQFIADDKNTNIEELKLASDFILNMRKDLKASVELLKTLLSGDPRNMTEDSFNKLLEKAKLEPSNMNNLIVSKSRTVDLSKKSGDDLLFPAEISKATPQSTELTDLLKDSLKYTNPPLVVVRAPDAEAGDAFLQSLGTWCKMHQEGGLTDLTQDAFNLLRATKDYFNPLTANDTNLFSVEQLIRLAEVSVEETPAPAAPPPTSSVAPASINIGVSVQTEEEPTQQKPMQDLAERFFTASEKASPVQKDLNAIARDIGKIIKAGNGQALQDIFLQGKNLKESHTLVLAVDKAHWGSPTEISYVDFCGKDCKDTVTWNKKGEKDDFAKIVVDAENKLEISGKADKQIWNLPAVLIMKSDGDQRSFAHINELP